MSEESRRLAAIVFMDVVGYSKMMGQDERQTLSLIKARRQSIELICAAYQGRMVKAMGDGFLLEFSSAVNAVRGAIDTQREMKRLNDGIPDGPRIELRIGIHLGDIIVDGGDVFGDGVNVAARLQPIAAIGGIAMSGIVRNMIGGNVDKTEFVRLGEVSLKNIKEPVEVWQVDLGPGTLVKDAPASAPAAPAAPAAAEPAAPVGSFFAEALRRAGVTANAATKEEEAPAATVTYEVEINSSGDWLIVGNFDDQDEAVASAKREANEAQCKSRVLEVTWDDEMRTSKSKLVIEFNGGLMRRDGYVPTDSAGRRRF